MEFLAVAFVFVFGTIVGSFINALSFRFGTGMTMWGRSRCFSCGKSLRVLELVPILSYIAQGGRCLSCKARISPQYPLVEVLAGILAVLAYGMAGENPVLFALDFLLWGTLLFVVVYDLRHMIIPDSALLLAGAFVLGILYMRGDLFEVSALLAGPVISIPFLLLSFFSRGKLMGWGDGKLMIPLGWYLGLWGGFVGLLFSFWIGALVSGVLLMLSLERKSRRLTMGSEIPFAPFLILGSALVHFTNADLFLTQILF